MTESHETCEALESALGKTPRELAESSRSLSRATTLGLQLYAEADRTRGIGISRLLHRECVMSFNGGSPACGAAAVEALVAGRHGDFGSISHEVRSASPFLGDGGVALETEVTYRLRSGGHAILHGCSLLRFTDDLVREWRVYVDPTPLQLAGRNLPDANHHVAVRVSDIDRAITFYMRAFNATVTAPPYTVSGELAELVVGGPRGVAWKTAMLQIGDGALEMVEFTYPVCPSREIPATEGRILHFAVTVADVAETVERVEQSGGRRAWPTVLDLTETIQVLYVADPDGNVIELFNVSAAEVARAMTRVDAETDHDA